MFQNSKHAQLDKVGRVRRGGVEAFYDLHIMTFEPTIVTWENELLHYVAKTVVKLLLYGRRKLSEAFKIFLAEMSFLRTII